MSQAQLTAESVAFAKQQLNLALSTILIRKTMQEADIAQAVESRNYSKAAAANQTCIGLLMAESILRDQIRELNYLSRPVA